MFLKPMKQSGCNEVILDCKEALVQDYIMFYFVFSDTKETK